MLMHAKDVGLSTDGVFSVIPYATNSQAFNLALLQLDKKACYSVNTRKDAGIDQLFAPTTQLKCSSDVDETMILHFAFQGKTRLSGLILSAPQGEEPTTIKIYTNRHTFGFDDVDSVKAVQEFDGLGPEMFNGTAQLSLKTTAFPSVNNMFIYLARDGSEVVSLSGIKFVGTGTDAADFSKLKKIGHEEGE